MGDILAIVPPTGRHMIGHMRRSDGDNAPCLGLLGGIVCAMGGMVVHLQAVSRVLQAGPRLLVGTSLFVDPGPRFQSGERIRRQKLHVALSATIVSQPEKRESKKGVEPMTMSRLKMFLAQVNEGMWYQDQIHTESAALLKPFEEHKME